MGYRLSNSTNVLTMKPKSVKNRVLHLVFEYVAPFWSETYNLNGKILGFSRERYNGRIPSLVQIPEEVFEGKKLHIHAEANFNAQFSVATNLQVFLAPLASGPSKLCHFLPISL